MAQHKRHLFLAHRVSFWNTCFPFGEWASQHKTFPSHIYRNRVRLRNPKWCFPAPQGKNTHHCYLHIIGQERPMPLSSPAKWHLCLPRSRGEMGMGGHYTCSSSVLQPHWPLMSGPLQAYFSLRSLCTSSSVVHINRADRAQGMLRASTLIWEGCSYLCFSQKWSLTLSKCHLLREGIPVTIILYYIISY